MDEDKIKAAIDKIRPALEMDGGGIEYLGCDGNKVKVKLTGACHGCPMSQMTLKAGVEAAIKEEVPEVEEVVNVQE